MRQKKTFLAGDLRFRCQELSDLEKENKKLKMARLGPSGSVKDEKDTASQQISQQSKDDRQRRGPGKGRKDTALRASIREEDEDESYMGS